MNKNWYKTEEEANLAEKLIEKEKDALEKWLNGDTSGYLELWSKHNFSYFDGVCEHRVDTHEEVKDFVMKVVEGKLRGKHHEFTNARVQIGVGMAVLTYELYQETNLIDVHYNCIEVFQKEADDWHVIHSTWSIKRPMEMDFSGMKELV